MLQLIQPRWQAKAAAVRAEAEAKLAEAVAATDEIVGTALKARLADLDRFWEKEQTVTYHRALGGWPSKQGDLGHFGADASVAGPSPIRVLADVSDAPQAFVKFLGEGDNRISLLFPTIEEIKRAGCHWAVAYPASKRPSGVKDDAVIFIARLTRDPNDIRVFGRAVGMRHRPAGTMVNGVSLNELMETLGADSFAPTQRNAARGKGNTNPRRAYLQRAAQRAASYPAAPRAGSLRCSGDGHLPVTLRGDAGADPAGA